MQSGVERLLDSHPHATLQDIYKSCFQDYFGVAHALSNRDKVEQYIIYETECAEQFETQYIELCGWRGDYVRVNLKAVRDSIVTASELADTFMMSQHAEDKRSLEDWQREWHDIMRAVRNIAPDLENFQRDSTVIAELLAEGKYVMHHSKTYNEYYHPHYRLVRRDVFASRFGSRF